MEDATGVSEREAYEEEHVHKVYSSISNAFSATRHTPWPVVKKFLSELPVGSVGIDAGTGNGKNLAVNPNVFVVASDRSEELVKIASQHKNSVAVVADSLALPHPDLRFDFAISIAVIHHFSSPRRRVQAVEALLAALRPSRGGCRDGGKVLIFVWALEQKGSRRGWDEGDRQDIMVPWVLKKKAERSTETMQTFHRYYHLYRRGELESDVVQAGGAIVDSGYDRDNWWAIATKSES